MNYHFNFIYLDGKNWFSCKLPQYFKVGELSHGDYKLLPNPEMLSVVTKSHHTPEHVTHSQKFQHPVDFLTRMHLIEGYILVNPKEFIFSITPPPVQLFS